VLADEIQGRRTDFQELVGANYPLRARQLGERTGALHNCLGGVEDRIDFSPEPFTPLAQRSLYQTMRSQLRRTEAEVTQKLPALDPALHQRALDWIAGTPRILEAFSGLLHRRVTGAKIRVHGDLHLGQVLNTGNDFVFLDIEGEPRRSLGERLLKRSPLVDVAGLLRSFDYAMEAGLRQQKEADRERLRPWADRWLEEISRCFLEGYNETTAGSAFLRTDKSDFDFLLGLFLLDKSVYEIGYELSYRPDFLEIPLAATRRLLGNPSSPENPTGASA
jgi:maltose alpha-D-glucosyltransferase/alpha-amylase